MTFYEYIIKSRSLKTIKEKLALAIEQNYAMDEVDAWVENDDLFCLCDFVAPGTFPGFLKESDAQVFCDLANEVMSEGVCNHWVEESHHGLHTFWTVD